MTTGIKLNSEQVLGIAQTMENKNNELQTLLNESKSTINALSSIWTGQAADQTRASYDEFSAKFFQQYHDVLEQYVTFLRRNVAEQYTQIETENTRLSDAFK